MTILILAGTVILAVLALGLGMFLFIFFRRRQPDYSQPAVLAASRWADFAAPIQTGAQFLADHHPRSVEIESFDGLTLRGQLVEHPQPRGVLILLHGYRSCPRIDVYASMPRYYQMGFTLLICDQRAHGASQGRILTMGIKERYDAARWAEFAANTFGREIPVYLGGISMGATTVLMAAELPIKANLRGIVADCGFTSPRAIIAYLMRRQYHLPPRPLLALLRLSCRLFGGFDLDASSTVQSLSRSHVPVLLFHGTDDHFVPKEMSEAAYAAAQGDKTLLEFPGAGHGLSYIVDGQRYLAALEDFFARTLPTGRTAP